jgi:hypothetical protein
MVGSMPRARFLPSLSTSVLPAERYHVTPRLGPSKAEARILEEMCDGTFRPPDAQKNAHIEEAHALFVPFWRVDIQRSDTAIRLGRLRVGGIPLPTQDSSEAKAVWMLCARTAFPYTMKHPSTLLPGDAKPLTTSLASLSEGDPSIAGGWEVLDADVAESTARDLAAKTLARHSSSAGAIFGESDVTVNAIHFVLYPTWFARYRYQGEATSDGNDLFYVGISAVDGVPFTAEHPSKLRSGAARVKKFFFDD